MPRLLVVHHAPSASLRRLLDAVLAGAADEDVQELASVDVVARPALEADADDVLGADGYVLVSPGNFGYMSGALKHFFDSTFLAVGGSLDDGGTPAAGAGATAGRPWGLLLHGRYDLTGAQRSVDSIVGALGWRAGHGAVCLLGPVDDGAIAAAYELGATIAALLADAATA